MRSVFGLPTQIMSDNGPAFVSYELAEFLRNNGISNLRSAPHHPKINGEAKGFVGTFQKAVKCSGNGTREELELRLQQFLLKYRTTLHATTNRTPAEMLFGFRPTTRLDGMRPSVRERVQATKDQSRCANQTASREREFSVNDKVFARFWYGTKRWRAGVILRRSGDATYDVQIGDQLHRWHSTQLLRDVGHTGDTPESEATREADQTVDEQTEPTVIAVAPPLNITRPNTTPFAVPSAGTVQPSTLTRSTVVPKAVPESERLALKPAPKTQDAPDAPRRSTREH